MSGRKPQKIPTIKWAMTPFPWHIDIAEDLDRARQMMSENDIQHLPVTEEGELVGVLSERDIRLVENAAARRHRSDVLRVGDACVRDVFIVETSDRLDRVLLEMARRQLGSVLVIKHKKLAGILTATDACRGFGELLDAMFPEGGEDDVA